MPYSVEEVDGAAVRDVVARMHAALFEGGKAAAPDTREGHWWLVLRKGEPVGFAGMCASDHYQHTGYLWRAGVAWDHQGRGLQKRLIRARLSKMRRLGWAWAVTDTERTNLPSANSLIRCGFRLFKPVYRWAAAGDALYWGRRL